jgi:hypothetical protein
MNYELAKDAIINACNQKEVDTTRCISGFDCTTVEQQSAKLLTAREGGRGLNGHSLKAKLTSTFGSISSNFASHATLNMTGLLTKLTLYFGKVGSRSARTVTRSLGLIRVKQVSADFAIAN